MSDLTATNCGCGCDNGCDNGMSNSNSMFGGECGCSILWILVLLSLLNNSGIGANNGCGCGNDGNSCWLILLLLFCCNGGCGNGIF